ncbi:hypothetical protein EUX98_g9364 [Antrodiella citrinella]|uniref:Integral membrane protein n=1 Tax=Antrodiella citrinella TaxID=2447956 RepID=A0A4S4M024_9APHY|nr:hypothetical protein EUX98_g9364 [Antrodiella citrinella]
MADQATAASAKRPVLQPSHYSTHEEHITKPFDCLHPTRAKFFPRAEVSHRAVNGPLASTLSQSSEWNLRASRKGRFRSSSIHVRHHPGEARTIREVLVSQRLRHPHSNLKVHLTWDVSFWVAIVFVLGSAAWIVNGFVLFLPLVNVGEVHTDAASWWAFVGGTLFELGSYLMLVESLNASHEQLFGPALWGHTHTASDSSNASSDEETVSEKGKNPSPRFRWIGLGDPRDLGYLASAIQMFAASIFWVSTITGIPGVIPNLAISPPTAIADVFYWTPQVIGGMGFVVSSALFMLEVQRKWWRPEFGSIGWYVAVFNLIGAIGFTLCGALGYGHQYRYSTDELIATTVTLIPHRYIFTAKLA